MAQPFNADRLELSGDAFPIADQIAGNPGNGKIALSVSDVGIMTYRTGVSFVERQVTWFDRAGNPDGTVGPSGDYRSLNLSNDGRHLALTRLSEGNAPDLWLLDLARGVPTRFTFDPAVESAPVWSPDGSRVVFRSSRNGEMQLYQKLASGIGSEDPFPNVTGFAFPEDWSSDGRFIVYRLGGGGVLDDLWVLPLSDEQKPFGFLTTPYSESHAQLSPDGRWLAYRSNESGRFEVYVQSFPKPASKWQISTGGGGQPRWRGDGKELYYVSSSSRLMAVPINAGAGLEVGSVSPLFDAPLFSTLNNFSHEYRCDRRWPAFHRRRPPDRSPQHAADGCRQLDGPPEAMSLSPGVRPGPLEIHSAIGAGGMGEGWKARDTIPGPGRCAQDLPRPPRA